ncbi:MAG: hypothetical protein DDT27_00507 [Dehalococcoidia bacterium]|nr:hypothetical protein [Chloroflexota bacterium]
MRKDEAQKVIEIIFECDGGCKYCVSSLLDLFIANFSEYEDIAKKAFENKFGIGMEDFLSQSHKEHSRKNEP